MRQGKRGETRDRELGMDRAIDRRDFLSGAAVALGAALAGPAFGARRRRRTSLATTRPC